MTSEKCFRILKTQKFNDKRGYFHEIFRQSNYDSIYVQDSVSFSTQNVLRGLHFQERQSQIATVLLGEIEYYVLCVDRNRPCYGNLGIISLQAKEVNQIGVTMGHAHGFQVKSDEAVVSYKSSVYYGETVQYGFNLKKILKDLGADVAKYIISERDLNFREFSEPIKKVKRFSV